MKIRNNNIEKDGAKQLGKGLKVLINLNFLSLKFGQKIDRSFADINKNNIVYHKKNKAIKKFKKKCLTNFILKK